MGKATPTACYRELGEELRKRRENAGLTEVELADRMGSNAIKICRMELATRHSSTVDVISYLAFLGIHGPAAQDLVELCREAERNLGYWLSPHGHWLPDSLSSLIYHEATADRSTTYNPHGLHGLLQTADYAHAWIAAERWRSPENVEECVRIRMDRQQVLYARRGASFTFFLHERALHRQVGNPAIMQEQLLKLAIVSALNDVTVRVVPASTGAEFGESFHLLEYNQFQPMVYIDNHATGLFLEDPDYVEPYRTLIPAIAKVALDGGQSREFIAALANEYDRGSERDVGVEEEQL